MSIGATTPRSTRSPSQQPSRDWLGEIGRPNKPRPSAAIVYGPPGIGKSSLAAAMPDVVFLTDHQERGIFQLREAGLVSPDVSILPPAETWLDAMAMLEALRGEHSYKSLAIDAMGGFERLCHEEVCRREFNGEWGKTGFVNYQQGYDVSLSEWRLFINAMDRLRDERSMSIMLLGHSRVSPFKNPEGPDYDRYNVDCHHKTWSLTHKWADMVIFANYEVAFSKGEDTKKKAKAYGGNVRTMYTEYSASYDAKNRHALPEEIPMGASGVEAWSNLKAAVKAGRKKSASNTGATA